MLENSVEKLIADQKNLWDSQHYQRGTTGLEGTELAFKPNPSAQALNQMLPPQSRIAEVGCANGRDARFLAKEGHIVYAMDFSKVALAQCHALARQQGILDQLILIEHDIKDGNLPTRIPQLINAFYARSALHIDDESMFQS